MKLLHDRQARLLLICWTVAFFMLAPLFILFVIEMNQVEQLFLPSSDGMAPDSQDSKDRLAFSKFVADFNKDYGSDNQEFEKRFQIFQEGLRYTESMNAKNLSYQLGVTMFSDMTDDEFLEAYATKMPVSGSKSPQINQHGYEERRSLKFLDNSKDPRFKKEFERLKYKQGQGQERYIASVDDDEQTGLDVGDYDFIDNKLIHCPTVDWVKQGKVLKTVKNQHKCGSCWAHNTVAAIENLYARYHDIDDPTQIPSLSEQQLVDCDTFPNIGCMGGEAKYAFRYAKKEGLTGSQHYSYKNKQEECRFNPDDDLYDDDGNRMPVTPVLFKIDQFKVYDHVTTRDLEKLSCEGVVSVPFRINRCIKHYISGIIDDRDGLCGCSQFGGPNHAVALVGFGQVNIPSNEQNKGGWRQVEGHQSTMCQKYWILRNSWTNRWGEEGYFRVCREDVGLRDGTCFVRHDAVLPLMNKRHSYSKEDH